MNFEEKKEVGKYSNEIKNYALDKLKEKEDNDIFQEKYEKLIMISRCFSRKERERIRQKEVKILKLKKD